MGAYVVRTSCLNDKHSCQLFKIAASFSSLVLLSSSVSTANLSCLPETTFSSLGFSSNQCPHLASIFWEWPGAVSSVSEALFALSFSFISEHFFLVHAKAALVCSRIE